MSLPGTMLECVVPKHNIKTFSKALFCLRRGEGLTPHQTQKRKITKENKIPCCAMTYGKMSLLI